MIFLKRHWNDSCDSVLMGMGVAVMLLVQNVFMTHNTVVVFPTARRLSTPTRARRRMPGVAAEEEGGPHFAP